MLGTMHISSMGVSSHGMHSKGEPHIDDGASRGHVLHGLLGHADHAHNIDHEGLFQAISGDVPEVLHSITLQDSSGL